MHNCYTRTHASDVWLDEHLPQIEGLAQKTIARILDAHDADTDPRHMCPADACVMSDCVDVLKDCLHLRQHLRAEHSGCRCGGEHQPSHGYTPPLPGVQHPVDSTPGSAATPRNGV